MLPKETNRNNLFRRQKIKIFLTSVSSSALPIKHIHTHTCDVRSRTTEFQAEMIVRKFCRKYFRFELFLAKSFANANRILFERFRRFVCVRACVDKFFGRISRVTSEYSELLVGIRLRKRSKKNITKSWNAFRVPRFTATTLCTEKFCYTNRIDMAVGYDLVSDVKW